jgi:tRNA dimethylallyltransferase
MKKLIIITGPTASGKTALAIKLAKRFNGEIISADSRAIYKGIDIASAKPSLEEREGVPHWGFDLAEPDQTFTAADFKKYAFEKISEIHSRRKIPFLVGGTGLYIDAVAACEGSYGLMKEDEFINEFMSSTTE